MHLPLLILIDQAQVPHPDVPIVATGKTDLVLDLNTLYCPPVTTQLAELLACQQIPYARL